MGGGNRLPLRPERSQRGRGTVSCQGKPHPASFHELEQEADGSDTKLLSSIAIAPLKRATPSGPLPNEVGMRRSIEPKGRASNR